MQVLDNLLTEYESSCHGPGKYRKLTAFLQHRSVFVFCRI